MDQFQVGGLRFALACFVSVSVMGFAGVMAVTPSSWFPPETYPTKAVDHTITPGTPGNGQTVPSHADQDSLQVIVSEQTEGDSGNGWTASVTWNASEISSEITPVMTPVAGDSHTTLKEFDSEMMLTLVFTGQSGKKYDIVSGDNADEIKWHWDNKANIWGVGGTVADTRFRCWGKKQRKVGASASLVEIVDHLKNSVDKEENDQELRTHDFGSALVTHTAAQTGSQWVHFQSNWRVWTTNTINADGGSDQNPVTVWSKFRSWDLVNRQFAVTITQVP